MVVLFDAVAEAGVLARLPGSTEEVAGDLGLDARALRVVLDALSAWEVVERRGEAYDLGAQEPDPVASASLHHHARALR